MEHRDWDGGCVQETGDRCSGGGLSDEAVMVDGSWL